MELTGCAGRSSHHSRVQAFLLGHRQAETPWPPGSTSDQLAYDMSSLAKDLKALAQMNLRLEDQPHLFAEVHCLQFYEGRTQEYDKDVAF